MTAGSKVKQFLGSVHKRFVRSAVILAYHRVADLAYDPHHMAVSPANFVRHVEYLKKNCEVMPLQELASALQQDNLPRRAVAITFDDGYLDVFEQAYPILKAAHSPATLFAPVGLIGEKREFWYDELDGLLLCSESLPEKMELHIQGQTCCRNTVSPGQREGAFWAVWQLMKPLHHDERMNVLNDLSEWAGKKPSCRKGYRPMNADELFRLSRDGWEVGSHTTTHALLSHLTADEQRREITEGRGMLADLLGLSVSSFAYPHGLTSDFTDETAAIVKDAGFRLGCTMVPGSVESGDDPFRLKRCAVFNWPAEVFAQKLDSFFFL